MIAASVETRLDSDDIELQRKRMLSDTKPISSTGNGVAFDPDDLTVRDACIVSKPARAAELLRSLVNSFKPSHSIELGTNIGVSSAYIARGCQPNRLTTFEVSSNRLVVAKDLHSRLGIRNVSYVEGFFEHTLAPFLSQTGPIDFAFIDGNHQFIATLDYFNLIQAHAAPVCLYVFDDIRWSDGMRQAWQKLSCDDRFSVVVDFDKVGVAVAEASANRAGRVSVGPIRIF